MTAILPDTAPILLLQGELAERWRISPRTLERWRVRKTGPVWFRLGGRVRYRLEDVLAYERARLHRSMG